MVREFPWVGVGRQSRSRFYVVVSNGGHPLFSPLLAVETGQGFPVFFCLFSGVARARAWVRVRTVARIGDLRFVRSSNYALRGPVARYRGVIPAQLLAGAGRLEQLRLHPRCRLH